ncbi:MAG: hypothetical protein H6Q13_3507, partial [Bacteroidetes bacterium]|nr:hypothetical protein [Bacteroidota bacterium]
IVIGYFAQGFMRLIISSFFWGPGVILGEFMHGLTGNIGSEFYPMDLFEKNPIGTITELVTSYILTFLLAIIMERIVERKILEKLYHNEEKKRLIPIAVLKANSISYSILFVWITFFVATN